MFVVPNPTLVPRITSGRILLLQIIMIGKMAHAEVLLHFKGVSSLRSAVASKVVAEVRQFREVVAEDLLLFRFLNGVVLQDSEEAEP